jgi:hypothetical protein
MFTLQRPAWAHSGPGSGITFISSILFSDDRHAGAYFPMGRMPPCLRAISALPHPLRLATYATARPKNTPAAAAVLFLLRVVSGETFDNPFQIINISFQSIPDLMLDMGTSGSFDIFT